MRQFRYFRGGGKVSRQTLVRRGVNCVDYCERRSSKSGHTHENRVKSHALLQARWFSLAEGSHDTSSLSQNKRHPRMGSLVLSAGGRWGERLQQHRVATSAAPHDPSNSAHESAANKAARAYRKRLKQAHIEAP